jgi:hypothetical protein
LQLQDFFFDRVPSNQFVARHHTRLANAMGTIGGLGFHGRIPPRVEVDDGVGAG